MSEAYGLPGISEVALQRDKEIFASYAVTPRLEGVTIAFAAPGEIAAGTVLARVAASGKYVAYNTAVAATGDNIPACVLRTHVASAVIGDVLGEAVFAGILKNDQVVGMDAEAIPLLGARVDTVRNTVTFGYSVT